ncbi:uncharacterized protein LOC100120788 [Nasonia vitripennis]|uniref:Uncharacterized protein n=1 Tax=Nasonia vitripennis TaxID=7425 RepID=A0A7M7TDD6_NASVI|nr:uncharacterized protein LOC100120788 [Nasonia vitripennis]
MESKKKFNKNRYWKRKYQPRNASTSTTVKKPVPNKDEGSNQSEDSEEYVLKQRLPENGWFPDFDSSSSSSDVESLTTVSSSVSISDAKKKITKETKSDENWFDRELDNVQFNSNVPDTKQCKSIKESEIKLKLSSSDSIEKEHRNSSYKLKSEIIKKSLQEAKKDSKKTSDNEEDELEFLLSLTEPVHTGPIILKNNLENERRLALTNNSSANDKPVKSIDLEKWLDSVLDD